MQSTPPTTDYHIHILVLLDQNICMAAISSPHRLVGGMPPRRMVLAEKPNLGNSPYPRRSITPIKRTRSFSNIGENTPPTKRQTIDSKVPPKTPIRKAIPPKIEKKGQAEIKISGRTVKQDRGEADIKSLETVLQWQRHYKKMFPGYVFYFENIPEETYCRCVRGIESLGAREVKFFSREVTHVITTRSIPTGSDSAQNLAGRAGHGLQQENIQPRTINPSLLERSTEGLSQVPRSKFNFDLASFRRENASVSDLNQRRPTTNRVDILEKAKELDIKIWQLEKLCRVLKTIFDKPQSIEGQNARNNAVVQLKPTKQVDLSQMIRDEQSHERGEREINTTVTEMVRLSGPYLYVRDMNEKTKPILVREYKRVERKEDGDWPQFRTASSGKCPFVEEDFQVKRMKEVRDEKTRKATEAKARAQAHAQATAARTIMQPPNLRARREPLVETTAAVNSARRMYKLPPPPAKDDSTFTNGKDDLTKASGPRLIGGEPVASGVQPSNITSAIQSQMISSTAAAPGARAGTSKEIHDLQRKALERSTHGLRQSQRMIDIAGSYGRGLQITNRAARQESPMIREEEEAKGQPKLKVATQAKKEALVREEKAGYCENCREKFKDFEMVGSRLLNATKIY